MFHMHHIATLTGSPSTISVSSSSRTPSPLTPLPVTNGGCEVYSRKVFVGGLPPDIDEGTHKKPLN